MTEGLMNLSAPRGERNVWDEPRWRVPNYDAERCIAAAVGSALAMLGARRGRVIGGLLAGLGATLTMRAALGYHDLRVAGDWLDRCLRDYGWRREDMVNEALEESFPASDAPAYPIAD